MPTHKTTALPLAWFYAGLIVYASLYPFADWRDQGQVPWAFLSSPLPKYWTGFDVTINVAGYVPMGFLLTLLAFRTDRRRSVVGLSVLLAGLLSLVMESIQNYLPVRVASNIDLALNVLGALVGAWVAWALGALGWLERWSLLRARWFVPDARGGLVLLALWPMALVFPAAVPFGLGQVFERMEAALGELLLDTPLLDWLPVRDIEMQPMEPATEWLCVTLGLLIPCLLSFCIVRSVWRRALGVLLIFGVGFATTALSGALSYGPEHAWAWLGFPTKSGLASAFFLVLTLLWVPHRVSAALLLLALGTWLSLLNQASASPYFAQTLATWEQGRFMRFNGVAQWLGWLWPYFALIYALMWVGQENDKN
jgi:VanZ family protein